MDKKSVVIRTYKETGNKKNNLEIFENLPKYDLGLIEGTFSRNEIYKNER